jgi:hypothetical protein
MPVLLPTQRSSFTDQPPAWKLPAKLRNHHEPA